MLGYSLPPQLDSEINQLEELVAKYKKGEASAAELKAHRVPFGVYEQRAVDTYMVRIRCVAGEVTPLQLEQVVHLASQYGVRDLHITSRQELQIHYVSLDDIVSIIRQLRKIGLSTRGGGGNTLRNITAQDDAGIDPDEEFDVSPYASALTTKLIAESDSWNLPRKYKIAFSGSQEDKGYATISDLGFIAKIKNGKHGFRVYAAGGLGAKSAEGKLLFDFIEAEAAYAVAKAIKNVFYKYGNRKNKHAARIRFLWEALGEDEFKKRFNEEYAVIKQDKDALLVVDEAPVSLPALQLAQEEPSILQDFGEWKKRFVRAQKQEGLYSIIIPVELGFIPLEQAIKLAQFLKPFGEDVLRMTRNQNFRLRNIPKEYLGNVYNFLSTTLAGFNRPAIYGNILSCAGASTCQLGFCLSRAAARALMKTLEASRLDLDKLGDIKLNISGCPNSCGQHPAADLGFFGKASRKDGRLYPAYNILAGAVIRDGETKLAEQVAEVPAKNLPALVKDLLGLYLSKNKTYANFQDYIAKEGKEDLKQLSGRYEEILSFEQDKNYYFDWDADTVFSLADRRAGECSAGLFDLIEVDLKNIRETKKTLSSLGEDTNEKAALLNKLVFYASRMLLITRGVEPKNEGEAFEAF
ncbi:MAG: nitrite/sulfite reductase, partial [Candidatus Omnitrophota bacterium]